MKYIVVAAEPIDNLLEVRKIAHELCEKHGHDYYLAEIKSVFKGRKVIIMTLKKKRGFHEAC